ncbi:BMC domain-containing protein [Pseudomonas delhiensis]|uniref:Carboxysome shell and ethanolamine utilization microcompartment protein CcmL/EutN n=1 Tax=Pseudomonas delhiensis TaxID=366289 RepID=A0A239EC42_9PSED|nr:BMC domain-containing protein [Pseudomonas delhiensis]SDI31462.1 Carboxysome shell and ethanolamine utilization microcompartment protein CcmL/EutN [Pseudomonas delhiensis]SNS42330.1 Carboxysome shell and ethanolamine utilization microcompartment protein CcmL/EutN [Pseudomonas delhiensis]
MHHAIGLIELTSIARGVQLADLMLKSADVQLLAAKTICPGKYIAMVGGEVAAVRQAVQAGAAEGGQMLVDQFVLANIHESVLPAISGVNPVDEPRALGVVETFSVAACIEAADAAVKAANVTLVRLHMAFGIGGKCYLVLTGEIADVEAAVRVACASAGEKGLLVHAMTVARPHLDLWQHLL